MKRTIALILALLLIALPALADAELVYCFPDLELHLPASWVGRLLVIPTQTGADFYSKASYDRLMQEGLEGGGYLFSLGASVNNSFTELESTIYLGYSERSCMNYYMELPTDYPAYMDEDTRADYDDMSKQLRGIAQGAVIYE